jgi:hypothetical protein
MSGDTSPHFLGPKHLYLVPSLTISDDAVGVGRRAQALQILLHLVSEGSRVPSPPADKVLRRHVDAQIPQYLGAEMTVVWSLDTCLRVVSLCIGVDTVDGQAHDLAKNLTNFIFGVLVLTREL